MKKWKIIVWVGVIFLVLVLTLYFNGYRLSTKDLNQEINQRLEFGTASISDSQIKQGEAIVVSRNTDSVVCRRFTRSNGFLWRYEGKSMTPINIIDYTKNEAYDSVLNRYVQQCSLSVFDPILRTHNDLVMDMTLMRFNNYNRETGYQYAETTRSNISENGTMVLVQTLSKGNATIAFSYDQSAKPVKIAITRIPQSGTENINDLFYGLRTIVLGNLEGWVIPQEFADQFGKNFVKDTPWVLKDEQVKIECIVPNEHYIVTMLS